MDNKSWECLRPGNIPDEDTGLVGPGKCFTGRWDAVSLVKLAMGWHLLVCKHPTLGRLK